MLDRTPSRAVGVLLALVAPVGVAQSYLGLPLRGAVWLGACVLVAIGVPLLAPRVGIGPTVVLIMMGLPWLAAFIDVLRLPRSRYGPTNAGALVATLVGGFVAFIGVAVAM